MNTVLLAVVLLGTVASNAFAEAQDESNRQQIGNNSPLADYQVAASERKLSILSSVATGRVVPTTEEFVGLLTISVQDPDEKIRMAALNMTAGRISAAAYLGRATAAAQHRDDALADQTFRAVIADRLLDEVADVRRSAVFALVSIDLAADLPRSLERLEPVRLSAPTAALLSNRFRDEADARVRAEILSGFVNTQSDQVTNLDVGEPVTSLVQLGLIDESPAVKQMALRLVRWVPSARQWASELLNDPNSDVRAAAVLAVLQRPESVTEFEDVIRGAIELETRPRVREAMEAALLGHASP